MRRFISLTFQSIIARPWDLPLSIALSPPLRPAPLLSSSIPLRYGRRFTASLPASSLTYSLPRSVFVSAILCLYPLKRARALGSDRFVITFQPRTAESERFIGSFISNRAFSIYETISPSALSILDVCSRGGGGGSEGRRRKQS